MDTVKEAVNNEEDRPFIAPFQDNLRLEERLDTTTFNTLLKRLIRIYKIS